jgi:hypothetical protein
LISDRYAARTPAAAIPSPLLRHSSTARATSAASLAATTPRDRLAIVASRTNLRRAPRFELTRESLDHVPPPGVRGAPQRTRQRELDGVRTVRTGGTIRSLCAVLCASDPLELPENAGYVAHRSARKVA